MLQRPSLNISADGRRAGPPRPPHPPSTPRVWFQPPFPPIQRQNLAFTLTLPPLLERSGSGTRTPCSISWDTEPRGALRCARTLAHARRREDQTSSRSRLVLARPLRHLSVPGAAVGQAERSVCASTTGPAPQPPRHRRRRSRHHRRRASRRRPRPRAPSQRPPVRFCAPHRPARQSAVAVTSA